MVTDPIQRVRTHTPDTDFTLDLAATLRRLAALPPSPAIPYLTVSLDWRPDGGNPGQRPARKQFEREADELLAHFGPRGPAFESVTADREQIAAYLDAVDPATQGIVIVACAATGVFEPHALALPVPTRLCAHPTPALSVLSRLADDHPSYAVLLADQLDATLSLITQAAQEETVSLQSNDYPRKQQQGGWSQQRFQARADERVAAFARGIAIETQRALDAASITMLIIAGDEVITSALDAAMHATVKTRLIATLRLDIRASEQEILAATLPVVAQAARTREEEAVSALRGLMGAGGAAAAGAADVLIALQGGQVMTLVVADSFQAAGWADYTLPLYGVGAVPAVHPAGGDPADIVPVALHEEVVRLAILTGADVTVVHSSVSVDETLADDEIPAAGTPRPLTEAAQSLQDVGEIGALLRFTIDA